MIVKAESFIGISNFLYCRSDNLFDVDSCLGGEFSSYHDPVRSCKDFTSNSALWILGKTSIQNGIGNLVADLVRMSLTD